MDNNFKNSLSAHIKMNNVTCLNCGGNYKKYIYLGFPCKICENSFCNYGKGIALYLMEYLPVFSEEESINGWALFEYEGNYLKGLWEWLTFKNDE